jgi:hypothetical protein
MRQLTIAVHDAHDLRAYVLDSGAGAGVDAMRVVPGVVTRHRVAAMAPKSEVVLVGGAAPVYSAAAGHVSRAAAADTRALLVWANPFSAQLWTCCVRRACRDCETVTRSAKVLGDAKDLGDADAAARSQCGDRGAPHDTR